LEGIITCLHDNHQRPITIINNVTDETSPTLPVNESSKLSQSVPDYIKQDIEEAERTYFVKAYKASVVMCRRALQIAIEQKPSAPQNTTLGPLRQWAQAQTPPLLSVRVNSLVEGIKDYGDGGAHRVEHFEPQTVAMVIHITVETLNELFP
jgi:hypothetical protein